MIPERTLRTFIYGSCVSRDTFEYLKPKGYTLVDYVARQSLISAYASIRGPLPEIAVNSAFQRRMIVRDWRSELVRILRRCAPTTDVLLWDLCDERLGVRLLDSGVATRSVDGIASGLDAELSGRSRLLEFGSQEHWTVWRRRLDNFAEALAQTGLRERLILLSPPWAERSSSGGPTPSSFGTLPRDANVAFARYNSAVESVLDCPVVTIDAKAVRSDAQHHWGEAPFHYVPEVYTALSDRIETLVR